METINKIWFDKNRIFMKSSEENIYSRPLEAYPELQELTVEQQYDFTIDEEGTSIRWEKADIDMHINSFYEKNEPKNNEVAEMFKKFPWLNISEVAKEIGINKSLLARYIYGISRPSDKRKEQIRETLHQFGKELLSA